MAAITKEQLKKTLVEVLGLVHQKNEQIVKLYELLRAEMAANVASQSRTQQAETALAQVQTDRDAFKAKLDELDASDSQTEAELTDLVGQVKDEASKEPPEIAPATPATTDSNANTTGTVNAVGVGTGVASGLPDTSTVDMGQPVVTGGTPGVAVTPSVAPGLAPGLANPSAIIPGIPSTAPVTVAPATVVETAGNPDNIVSA